MEIKTIKANDLFREYDGLVGLTMLNLYTLSKDREKIRLINFNRKNPEHLYLLRVALMARDVYNKPVEVAGSWWDIFCLNWKIRKGFEKIKRDEWGVFGIDTQEVLDFMRQDGINRLGESFTFADIYHQYYEGSLN
jgi:hypothetical protein